MTAEKKIIGKKSNQILNADADREISTLGSTDNIENSVNLVSGIFRLLSALGFSVCIGDQ